MLRRVDRCIARLRSSSRFDSRSTQRKRKTSSRSPKIRRGTLDDGAEPRKLSKDERGALSVALVHQGLKHHEIAKVLSVSVSTVEKDVSAYRELFPTLERVKDYQANRAELIDAVEELALQSISRNLQSPQANLRDSTVAFRELFHAGRLERGKSTANIEAKHSHTVMDLSAYQTPLKLIRDDNDA